jgi:hypothetical protein
MAIKVDGSGNKLIFAAGAPASTAITLSSSTTLWTLTLPPNAGTADQALITDGTGVCTWGTVAAEIIDDTTTATDWYPLFSDITSGLLTTEYVSSTKYTYNPLSGQLTALNVKSSAGIHLNTNIILANYTIPATTNGLSAGPMTVPAGISVTVNPGSAWVVA